MDKQRLFYRPTLDPVITTVPPRWWDCCVYLEYSSLNSRNLFARSPLMSSSFIRHSQLPPKRDGKFIRASVPRLSKSCIGTMAYTATDDHTARIRSQAKSVPSLFK